MQVSILSACAIAAFSAAMLSAQEQLPLEEVLSWFPYDTYKSFAHIDIECIRKADIRSEFEIYLYFKQYYTAIKVIYANIPDELRSGLISMTYANRTTYQILDEDEAKAREESGDGVSKIPFDDWRKSPDKDEVSYLFIGEKYSRLFVFRFDCVAPQVERLKREGVLRESGEKIHNDPVYRVKLGYRYGFEDSFAWATPLQELLIAPDLETLDKMVAAGFGLEMSIVDSEYFISLSELRSYLGQFWDFNISGWVNLEVMLEYGKTYGIHKDQIARMEDWLREGGFSFFKTTLLSDSIQDREIFYEGDSERLGRRVEAMKTDYYLALEPPRAPYEILRRYGREVYKMVPPEVHDYQEQAIRAREVRAEGHLIISEILYDEELIASMRKCKQALEEQWKELLKPKKRDR